MGKLIKVYPCPKCQSNTFIVKEGMRVECLMCWSTALINAWNKLYREGVRERAAMRKRERTKKK